MIGSTISHYRILKGIGAGGMGEVYLAEDLKLGRKVALKLLPDALTRDADRKRRFIHEARAAAAVEHPHIAAVYDIDEVQGHTFIVMEYVRGKSLRQLLQQERLSLRRAIDLAVQVTEALAKVHERGLVHRDLKPANVLVSEEGYAKIIDFGLAKLVEPVAGGPAGAGPPLDADTEVKTRDGQLVGTVAYLSPEQARGAAIDVRSDVFSFGVLLYEMITGRAPFKRGSIAETLSAILAEEPASPTTDAPAAPPELERILKKSLAKDPGERYQHMRDLVIDLRELRDRMTRETGPLLAGPRSRRFRLSVLALAVCALGALGLYLLARRTASPPGRGASGRPAIAVMNFDDHTGAPEIAWLSKGVPQMLNTALAETPGLDVIGSQRLHAVLKEAGQESLQTIDPSRLPEIARKAGAGTVVTGSIFKTGSEIRIEVRVEDVSTGRILSAQSVTGADVIPLVDQLTERIRGGLRLTDVGEARGVAEVTTPSLEAYRLYSEGVEALRNQRWAAARTLLIRAVDRDPAFAMAYFELAHLAATIGEPAVALDFHNKAAAHVERLPERQKLLLRSAQAWILNDLQRAIELLEKVIARYPDEGDAYRRLGATYGSLSQPEKAVHSLERGVKALPHSGPLHNDLGYFYLLAGRYSDGLREFEAYARLSPREPNAYDSLGEAYLVTGEPDKALEKYARALALDASFRNAHRGRAWAFAMLGRYPEALAEISREERANTQAGFPQSATRFVTAFILSRVGRYRESEEEIRQGIRDAESVKDVALSLSLEVLSSIVSLDRKNLTGALEKARRAKATLRQLSSEDDMKKGLAVIDLVEGVCEAHTGKVDAARERLQSWKETGGDPVQEWLRRALEGEIALVARDLSAADRAFAAGEPKLKMWFSMASPPLTIAGNNLLFRDGRARVKVAQGDLAGAIAIYQQLNTPSIASKWTAMLEPRYVLELARLYDRSGDRTSARREHQRFRDLWKNADPGLPELEEATQYLSPN